MAVVATDHVVADFYAGVEFPSGWAEHPTHTIGAGLAGKRVLSAAVLLDANAEPLAACWWSAGADEQFVRIGFDDATAGNLLDGLNDAMTAKSRWITGHADLFATMLWEPGSLRPDQGLDVHPPRHGSFFDPIAEEPGWNVAPRELVAKAAGLLLVARRRETGLSVPVPANAAEMRLEPGAGDSATFVVLPAGH